MSNIKKLMMTAASGGEALNVEDVFSTYLYEGTGSTQGIPNGIALGDGVGGGTSTEFDGVSDFLSRSSDLTGNADGKTFTLSCWVYRTGAVPLRAIYPFRMQGYFYLEVGTNGAINVGGANTSGSTILEATLPSGTVPLKVWTHILVSVDLSNTSNRHIYLNDVAASPTWASYSNQNIDFTRTTSHINSNTVGSFGSARHAHIYLDYTYRDLSVTSNRRYFIDADGGSTSPSTLSALSPIVYMPMTSDYSIGENLGTGGDYTVNGSPKVVQSGTEYLSGYGEGGLVWIKTRSTAGNHLLFDTTNGGRWLESNSTGGLNGSTNTVTFNSDGWTGTSTVSNASVSEYASWTFRKAPKFFDVVTYTGTGSAQNISHNLGSTPAVVIVKMTSGTGGWFVYHSSVGATKYLRLETTGAGLTNSTIWNNTAPTDTQFTVGTSGGVNQSGGTYVAYLFAHNDGDASFGPDGDADIIKCGSWTTAGTGSPEVNLGFEPQWIMFKRTDGTGDWRIYDTMRGWLGSDQASNAQWLKPNTSAAESTLSNSLYVTPTGFVSTGIGSGTDYIYIAIRRGPMAVPTDATDVFAIDTFGGTAPTPPAFISGFPVDFAIRYFTGTDSNYTQSRLTGETFLQTNSTSAEVSSSPRKFDYMDGYYDSTGTNTGLVSPMWKRAPNYFDVVAYTGNGTAGRTVSHNLGVAPEMMWVKRRNTSSDWAVYHSALGNTDNLFLNGTNATASRIYWNNTTPTATQFSLGDSSKVSNSGTTYIAYLFASLDGVSKVGSYTGNGSLTGPSIDCGFSAGPRFVLIKRTDSAENWYVFDSERGIVAGADPYLMLNSTAAEINAGDIIDPTSSGFQLATNGSIANASGGTYIFYAIA